MIKLIDLSPINLQECSDCERDTMDWTHGEDHEASMADSELKHLVSRASKVMNMIQPGDELPGWVSAYITLASDYMNSVAQYMDGKMDEKEAEISTELPKFAVFENE